MSRESREWNRRHLDFEWPGSKPQQLVCSKLMARQILTRFEPDKKSAVLRQKIGYCAAAFNGSILSCEMSCFGAFSRSDGTTLSSFSGLHSFHNDVLGTQWHAKFSEIMWHVLLKAVVGFGAFSRTIGTTLSLFSGLHRHPITCKIFRDQRMCYLKKWTFKKTCIQSVLKTL